MQEKCLPQSICELCPMPKTNTWPATWCHSLCCALCVSDNKYSTRRTFKRVGNFSSNGEAAFSITWETKPIWVNATGNRETTKSVVRSTEDAMRHRTKKTAKLALELWKSRLPYVGMLLEVRTTSEHCLSKLKSMVCWSLYCSVRCSFGLRQALFVSLYLRSHSGRRWTNNSKFSGTRSSHWN